MRRTRSGETTYFECDGCGYVIGLTREEHQAGVLVETHVVTLRVPWPSERLEFHFHAPRTYRSDCFRYWAHSPRIMRRSLTDRAFGDAAIDEFMAAMLYRDRVGGVGVAPPPKQEVG